MRTKLSDLGVAVAYKPNELWYVSAFHNYRTNRHTSSKSVVMIVVNR